MPNTVKIEIVRYSFRVVEILCTLHNVPTLASPNSNQTSSSQRTCEKYDIAPSLAFARTPRITIQGIVYQQKKTLYRP